MELRERPGWRVAGLSAEVVRTLRDMLSNGVGPTARGWQGDEEAAEGRELALGEIGGAPGSLLSWKQRKESLSGRGEGIGCVKRCCRGRGE